MNANILLNIYSRKVIFTPMTKLYDITMGFERIEYHYNGMTYYTCGMDNKPIIHIVCKKWHIPKKNTVIVYDVITGAFDFSQLQAQFKEQLIITVDHNYIRQRTLKVIKDGQLYGTGCYL